MGHFQQRVFFLSTTDFFNLPEKKKDIFNCPFYKTFSSRLSQAPSWPWLSSTEPDFTFCCHSRKGLFALVAIFANLTHSALVLPKTYCRSLLSKKWFSPRKTSSTLASCDFSERHVLSSCSGFPRLQISSIILDNFKYHQSSWTTSNIINYLGQLQISSITLDNFKYHQLSLTTSNIIKYLGQLLKYQQLSWTTSKIINYLGQLLKYHQLSWTTSKIINYLRQLLKYHQSSWTTSNIFKCLRRDHDYDHFQLSTQLST